MERIDHIAKTVSLICEERPEIVAAFIFGSLVKNTTRKSSDVDVALLLEEQGFGSFSIFSFISLLENSLGARVDVTILNRAGELLKHQVRKNRKLVFERSSDKRKRFEMMGRKTYEDFLYLHKRYVNKVLYGAKNG